jgi:hypothetical protein
MHWIGRSVTGSRPPAHHCAVIGLSAMLGSVLCVRTMAQQHPEKNNMELVGYSDLQGRSAYQPVVEKQGDRWIAYIGHHAGVVVNSLTGQEEANGTSILDVTDPKNPKYIAHIPGELVKAAGGDAGGAQMVRVCSGSELPHGDKSKFYLLRSFGNTAHEMWDITNPAKPSRITVIVSGLRDTHKSWWECDTGIAYLVSGAPGWRTNRMGQVYDLSNPAIPIFIRDFGLPGQQPGSTGPVPSGMHGPISTGPKGNRVYFAYGPSGDGVVQIVDREKLLKGPKEPTEANLLYPQISRVDLTPDVGAHTAFPVLGMDVTEFSKDKTQKTRDFLVVPGESVTNECTGTRQMVRTLEITTETRPFGVSTWMVPEKSDDFCSRGGHFGVHSSNENFTPIYYRRVIFIAYFNAGVRALDIRNPYEPKEIGYYIPAITEKTDQRCAGTGSDRHCKVAIQTNNVEVDDRGYIYATDRANTGLHILELTGAARQVANLP